MGIRGRTARAAVAEVLEEDDFDLAPVGDSLTPLYAAALLKISLELRRPGPQGTLDQLLDRVLEGTPVDREAFRGYLERNFALVKPDK
jgi:hypothetical protein